MATILDDTVVYFWSPFLPADVLHPLNTLCACVSQYPTREETNITDVRWRLAQVPRLAVTEVPWWHHAYRPFHTALLDVISTTIKASCVYEFLFFFFKHLSQSVISEFELPTEGSLWFGIKKGGVHVILSSANDLYPLGLHFHELFFKATLCIDSCYRQRDLTFKNNQYLFYSFETEE